MKKKITLFCLVLCSFLAVAQNTYFPPLNGEEWESISPDELGWCTNEVDSLVQFLEDNNTKAFLILKEGRIVMEHYFDEFTVDSFWYWASAGKTLTSYLVGMAQEEGLLSISDPTSDYLGTGWTSTSSEQEAQIKIRHQLSMNTGLNDGVVNSDCLEPSCLEYLAAPGSRWAYHNAPYRLLQDVIENASGMTFNQFTNTRLEAAIGMKGFWLNYIYLSRARDAARFGLLLENEGQWDGQAVLANQGYFQSMINSSQDLNLSYGYLTWLNGKASHMLPSLQFVFNEKLIPNAPDDMFAALGKNDQKIHVVPSMDLVVVRLGNSSDISLFAVSPFDDQLWGHLNKVICTTTAVDESKESVTIETYPNPVLERLFVSRNGSEIHRVKVYNQLGQLTLEQFDIDNSIDFSAQAKGMYWIQFFNADNVLNATKRIIKQ